jgi:cell division protein ZipA
MSSGEFRWLLLFFGVLVLVGIYLHGRWQMRQGSQQGTRRDAADQEAARPRREPFMAPPPDEDETTEEMDGLAPQGDASAEASVEAQQGAVTGPQVEQPALVFPDLEESEPAPVAAHGSSELPPPHRRPEYKPPEDVEKVVLLHVRGRGEERFRGRKVLEAASLAGLTLGREGMFHRVLESESGKPVLFSMANMLNPGVFEVDKPAEIDTVGVSLFMSLPGAREALEAFDAMHAAANRIGEVLGGEVLDENLSTLSRQRLLHLRDEMRAFDRSRHLH